VPFVLRLRQDGDGMEGSREWGFVTECYVQGIMDGELVVRRNQQGVDLENLCWFRPLSCRGIGTA
jgi:hypothetical protein